MINFDERDVGCLLLLDGLTDSIVENDGEVQIAWYAKIERNLRGQITELNFSASEATVPELLITKPLSNHCS